MDFEVPIGELRFAGEEYSVEPALVPVHLDVSRLSGRGYTFRLSFAAVVHGPCMRCLKDAVRRVEVEAREVETGAAEEAAGVEEDLVSPYVEDDVLALAAWARDALVLSLPSKILCREDCPGLCPVCAADLSEVSADHHHDAEPDSRWAALRELRLD